MKVLKIMTAALMSAMASSVCFAEETAEVKEAKKVEFSVNADVVSSYVWRGMYQSSFAVQPGIEMTVGNFTLGSWGSASFKEEETRELDFYASIQAKAFSFGITDYFCTPSWSDHSYFADHSHVLEANLGWDFAECCEKFAMTISANINFLNDKKINDEGEEKEAFSTYIELGYPVESKYVNWDFTLGACVNESGFYGVDKFGVINIGVKASKDIEITDKFKLPLFAQMILNPRTERAHFVVGLSF